MTKRRAITTAWMILSTLSGIFSWAALVFIYVYVFGPFSVLAGDVAADYGTTYPAILPFIAGTFSDLNAAFVIVGIGVFVFMVIFGYIFEPQQQGVYYE